MAAGRFRRNLTAEKEQTRAATQEELVEHAEQPVQQAVRVALSRMGEPLAQDFANRIGEILWRCAVVPSALRGTWGPRQRVDIAGDGSAIPSQASGNGKAICACRPRERCSCDRHYADPEARWGWDSHEKRFIFGYRIHALMAPIAGSDLPVHIAIAGANAPDVLSGVDAMERFEKLRRNLLPELHVRAGIFDKGYDAMAYYRFLLELEASPVIPLSRHSVTPADTAGIPRDANGTPLCAGALPMRRHGFDKAKGRLVYNCPIKRPTHAEGLPVLVTHRGECPLGALCEPESKMGPLLYLPILENPRLNPPIARGGELYRELFARRTSVERFFSTATDAGKLGKRPYRRKHLFLLALLGHALVAHARAWLKQERKVDDSASGDGILAALFRRRGAPGAKVA